MVVGKYRPDNKAVHRKPHPAAVMTAALDHGRFELSVVPPSKRKYDRTLPSEQGTCDVYLSIPDQQSVYRALYNLTQYTVEELKMIREIFDKAFALASPIVEERDNRAQEEQAARPDLFVPRLARSVPRLSVLPGFESEHAGQLPEGYQDVPDSDGGDQV